MHQVSKLSFCSRCVKRTSTTVQIRYTFFARRTHGRTRPFFRSSISGSLIEKPTDQSQPELPPSNPSTHALSKHFTGVVFKGGVARLSNTFPDLLQKLGFSAHFYLLTSIFINLRQSIPLSTFLFSINHLQREYCYYKDRLPHNQLSKSTATAHLSPSAPSDKFLQSSNQSVSSSTTSFRPYPRIKANVPHTSIHLNRFLKPVFIITS